jgi:hypothetical protein
MLFSFSCSSHNIVHHYSVFGMQDGIMYEIGPRIKYFAKRCYHTQNKFCEQTGLDATQLSYYIVKGRFPGGEVLARFYAAGMSLDWLFGGGDDVNMFADNEAGKRLREERAQFKQDVNNVKILSPDTHAAVAEAKVISLNDYQQNLEVLQKFISFMRETAA